MVVVRDRVHHLELSSVPKPERYCPECQKIARKQLQFPLLRSTNEADQKGGPILPLALIGSLSEHWARIGSPLPLCTDFLSQDENHEARTEIGRRLFQIFHLADNGDQKALGLLIDVATHAVQGLEDIARRQPHLLRPFARKSSLWPSFIGRKTKALAVLHKRRLRQLQIGADAPYRGNWQFQSVATLTAIYMQRWLKINQWGLRLPSSDGPGAASKWFDVGWQRPARTHQWSSEEDKFLKPLGQRGLPRIAERYKRGKLPKRSEAVNRRAEIRRRVKQAYMGLVRNVLSA